jgi:signal transduction histidine kinase/CheY-like chemotaxis protein
MLAHIEFAIYQEHFNDKMVFWVNDVDKIFYSAGTALYIVNPDDLETYWYNLTLYETEKFNFNINYNPDLDQINLWVNVPVFVDEDAGKKPLGLLGIGINLTDFSNFVASSYREFDENITPYMFNKYNEITSAVDYELVQNKIRLDELLGETGKELIKAAHALSEGERRSFIYDKKIYLVNSIPAMEWYLAVSYPLPGLLALNRAMNTEFFSMLFIILFLFIIINVFIARSENAMAEHNLQLIEANRKAEFASRAKSDFLAKMSHEIRTPMNAITGMTELLLRGELSDESRGQVQDIKQAGINLISIINDILDFSKIESGKLEIVPVRYMLSSLVNDTVNIIRTRFMEKPLRFFTNIDGNIPNGLIGDEVRLRQIILNLLSNAVKYSEKGYIGLTITMDKRDDKQILLRIAIADTGRGIKPEEQAKLFSEFVRVDTKNNRGIEGTGLGLAIAKRLCLAMGGDISMESEYGKGSVFTVVIPQDIESKTPFAIVEEPEKKKVLVYEGRAVYARSLCWTLENMGVPYIMVTNQNDFADALYREKWFYVFSGYGLYEKIKLLMGKDDAVFYGGKKPPLGLMIEWGTEAYIPGVRFVSIPVQSLSIANVLNGRADAKDYAKSSGINRFTFPSARLLVVDDIATNLQVAEGLLAPYGAVVDTSLNGSRAIEMVKRAASEMREYDIIFMDHMMPEMDGIETTAAIRAWEKEQQKKAVSFAEGETRKLRKPVPIIALTANAVVGMREMFIENGFNDFLSKPIDVFKLDEILDRWIAKEKRGIRSGEHRQGYDSAPNLNPVNLNLDSPKRQPRSPAPASRLSFPNIPGVDTAKGIALTGGTVAGYRTVLSLFCKDMEDRLPLLQKAPDADTMSVFITQVHALKSASASIGASEISALASGLESVGKAGDTDFIRESLPDFVKRLSELKKNIRAALEEDTEIAHNVIQQTRSPEKTPPVIIPLLRELAVALKLQKADNIHRILEQLALQSLDDGIKKTVDQISDEVLIAEYGKALKIVQEACGDD